jgi:hypothetical protein
MKRVDDDDDTVPITTMPLLMRQTCTLISIIFSSCAGSVLRTFKPADRNSNSAAAIATYHLGPGNNSAVIIIMTGNQQQPGGPPRTASSTSSTGSTTAGGGRSRTTSNYPQHAGSRPFPYKDFFATTSWLSKLIGSPVHVPPVHVLLPRRWLRLRLGKKCSTASARPPHLPAGYSRDERLMNFPYEGSMEKACWNSSRDERLMNFQMSHWLRQFDATWSWTRGRHRTM